MKLIFIGADHEVTGSCHFLSLDHPVYGSKPVYMLVDCGMEQGPDYFENKPLPVKAQDIRYVFLTHAHVDHSGMLPKLYRDGFRGTVLTTSATKDLSEIMLRDAAHIQVADAEYAKKKKGNSPSADTEPAFTMEDAEGLIRLIESYRYDKTYDLEEGIRFRFTDVGHLLGSASVEIWLQEKDPETGAKYDRKLVFSGDIGNRDQPILRDPQRTKDADYVIMESTYGDRLHEISPNRLRRSHRSLLRITAETAASSYLALMQSSRHTAIRTTAENMSASTLILHRRSATEEAGHSKSSPLYGTPRTAS